MTRQSAMADRVYPAVNVMKVSRLSPAVNGILAEACRRKLAMRHNAVLRRSPRRYLPARCGRFIADSAIKVHHHASVAGEGRRN